MVDPNRRPRRDWLLGSDIDKHISGIGATAGNHGMIGVGNMTYLDFMFYAPSDPTDSIRFHNALEFAKSKGLLDDEDVVQRRLRETGRTQSNKGGGNGWQCDIDPQTQRKVGCKVGTPQQYCVNNGSQYC
jgi:hypothetical protein